MRDELQHRGVDGHAEGVLVKLGAENRNATSSKVE